jgi:hypothetical protein
MTYRIDTANAMIRTENIGDVTMGEVSSFFQELARDPDCPDHVNVLFDLTKQTWVPRSDDLRMATCKVSNIRGRVQFEACALVACTDVLFGMSRMFQVFAEDVFREVEVFRSVADAEAWLANRGSFPEHEP